MLTYSITSTGPKGFQVSVTGPYPLGTYLVADFGSLTEAEAFADWMRAIDAGQTTLITATMHAGIPNSNRGTDHLIRRNRPASARAEWIGSRVRRPS